MRRFSSEELFALRNNIGIREVICDILKIPGKEVEGIFRFLCPQCKEFQTAINPKTNLSRCFRCQRNFNNIEIVMQDKQLGFVASVKLLMQHTDKPAHSPVSVNKSGSHAKIYDLSTSSDGCLSSLERQLVDLAAPQKNQCLSDKNA